MALGGLMMTGVNAQLSKLPVVEAVRAPQKVVLDGKLDPQEWKGAAKVELNHYTSGKKMDNPTEVFLMYDDQNLYIGYINHENQMDKVVSEMTTEDGAVYLDDCVEVMINPSQSVGERSYIHLAANIAGVKYTANLRNPYKKADWQVKTARQAKSWTAEIVIPFSYLKDENSNSAFWRINLYRERKPVEQYYSWSLTNGMFHSPYTFGVLKGMNINGKFVGLKSALNPVSGEGKSGTQEMSKAREQVAEPVVIIPKPVKFALTGQDMVLTSQSKIIIPSDSNHGQEQAAAEINEELVNKFGMTSLPIVRTNNVSSVDGCIVLGEWNNVVVKPIKQTAKPMEEGYVLEANANRVLIVGTDEKGTYYGAQSLKQLFRKINGQVVVKGSEIWDQPAFPVRSCHIIIDKDGFQVYGKMIKEIFAKYKFNQLVVEVEHGIKWKSRPEIAKDYAMTTDDARALAKLASDRFIEIVPLVQSLGHGEWMFEGPGGKKVNLEFCEDTSHPYAYCPLDPRSYEFILPVIQESLDIFKPNILHIGHDEVDMFGKFPNHEYCKAVGKYDLYFMDTIKLYNYLKDRGVKTMIWGDLFPKQGYKDNLPALPRDIIIADWRYGDELEQPTMKMYEEMGFETLGCTWYSPLNISRFSEYAHKVGAKGMMGTTWSGYKENISIVERTPEQVVAYILDGDWFWNPVNRDVINPGYNPYQILNDLWYGKTQIETKDGFNVNLSPAANFTLIDKGQTGFVKVAAGHDLSNMFVQANKGVLSLQDSVKYRVSTIKDVPAAVAVKGYGLMDTFPAQSEDIKVNQKASTLAFLNASVLSAATGSRIGQYVVNYVDGSKEIIPLVYGKNIAAWDDQEAYLNGKFTWNGKTATGYPIFLLQCHWTNPKPNVAIKSIVMESNEASVAPFVMAITGF